MSKWFDLANELESMFRDWQRQDDEYSSALMGLEYEDRDEGQEKADRERINQSREAAIESACKKHLGI